MASIRDPRQFYPNPFAPKETDASEESFVRREPTPEELALSPTALAWKDQLPTEVRPQALCDMYPRLANRIAQAWESHHGCLSTLNELLTDTRGNRQGFPRSVAAELRALRRMRLDRSGYAGS